MEAGGGGAAALSGRRSCGTGSGPSRLLGKRQRVIAGICADTDVWGLYLGDAKMLLRRAPRTSRDSSSTGRRRSSHAPADEEPAEMLAALTAQYYGGREPCCPGRSCCPSTSRTWRYSPRSSARRARPQGPCPRAPSGGRRRSCWTWPCATPGRRRSGSPPARSGSDRTLELLARRWRGLPQAPERMEAYDISNTGSSDIVASMTVFQGARPAKRASTAGSESRSWRATPTTTRSMQEVLRRRLQRYAGRGREVLPPARRVSHRRRRDPRRGGPGR